MLARLYSTVLIPCSFVSCVLEAVVCGGAVCLCHGGCSGLEVVLCFVMLVVVCCGVMLWLAKL